MPACAEPWLVGPIDQGALGRAHSSHRRPADPLSAQAFGLAACAIYADVAQW